MATSSTPLVAERIRLAGATLTPADRKVAHVVGTDPQLVAFGTVADVAARAGTSGAAVVRLATRLGYEGFAALQGSVQAELSDRLRPAAARIRELRGDDTMAATWRASHAVLDASFGRIRADDFAAAVGLLGDQRHRVWALAGDAGDGILGHAIDELSMLRRDVVQLRGNPVAVARRLAEVRRNDVVVALDVRRYDQWLLDAVELASGRGARILALSDSPTSPLATRSDVSLVIDATGNGPFDNYVGAMGVLTALIIGVAQHLQSGAADALDRIERAWGDLDALSD